MKHLIVLSTILFFLFTKTSGQKNLAVLQEKFRSADSVIIVFHDVTAGIVIKKDVEGAKEVPLPKIMINGELNDKIVRQKCVLRDTAIRRLSKILIRPFEDTKVERSPCHICEHSILLFIKRKASFIDISFGCRTIVNTSKDIKISEFDFDYRKWNELIAFFKQHGISTEQN